MKVFVVALAVAAIAVPAAAQAGTCEDTFQKKGSEVSGLRFIATTVVPDLTPKSAIQQLRGIAAAKGYDIMTEEADYGSMLIEQPMTGKARAFPIEITATQAGGVGTVVMEAKLRAFVFAKKETAMPEMCGMLNQLKGGKAGLAAAAKGKSATTTQAAPLKISALSFSHQVSKDTERNAGNVLTRYKGKQYTIDGTVDYVTKDPNGQRVAFDVPEPYEEVIKLPNTAPFKTDIVCYMAPGTAAFTAQLKPKKGIKLTGT
ncbi:MAG: hypothetical protein ACRCY3_15195, partial [Sphingorhabdus sp.]